MDNPDQPLPRGVTYIAGDEQLVFVGFEFYGREDLKPLENNRPSPGYPQSEYSAREQKERFLRKILTTVKVLANRNYAQDLHRLNEKTGEIDYPGQKAVSLHLREISSFDLERALDQGIQERNSNIDNLIDQLPGDGWPENIGLGIRFLEILSQFGISHPLINEDGNYEPANMRLELYNSPSYAAEAYESFYNPDINAGYLPFNYSGPEAEQLDAEIRAYLPINPSILYTIFYNAYRQGAFFRLDSPILFLFQEEEYREQLLTMAEFGIKFDQEAEVIESISLFLRTDAGNFKGYQIQANGNLEEIGNLEAIPEDCYLVLKQNYVFSTRAWI